MLIGLSDLETVIFFWVDSFCWGKEMNGGNEVVAAPAGPPQPLDWKFSQVFGERAAGEEVQEGISFFFFPKFLC